MAVWCAGHTVDDFYQGLVPAMVPFMAVERGYSYSALAALAMAATVGSALPQPIFGIFADQRPTHWMAPWGVAVAGVAACAASLASSYAVVWLLLLVSGLGVAAFHPAAGRGARLDAGDSVRAMSWFATGGKVGFALAPLIVTPIVAQWGLRAVLPLAAPALIMGPVLFMHQRNRTSTPSATYDRPTQDQWRAFLLLTVIEVIRSTTSFGVITFIALYFVHHLGSRTTTGGVALALFLAGGIVGTLLGGSLADHFGAIRTVQVGGALIIPTLMLFRFAPTIGGALVLALVVGAAINIPFAVMVKLGQDYLPHRPGTAAGVTLGLAVSAGGIFMPALGTVADRAGIASTFNVLAAIPIAAVVLSWRLPRP